MFDQILVPIDQSLLAESILPHVISMAPVFQSKVVVMHVLDSIDGTASHMPTDPFDWQIQRSGAQAYLKDVVSRLNKSGLTAETVLLEGNVSDHIIQYSNQKNTNLIMLSSHGQGGISGWNMSSVATKIIQQARTSLMVVCPYPAPEKDPTERRYQRILAPVDGSKRAEHGLAMAENLARSNGAELLIVQVIKPPEMPRRVPLSEREQDLVNQVVEANRMEAAEYLNELQDSINYPKTKTILLIDQQVTHALHTLVTREEIDLVVLTAHGLSGNPNLPYGNVAVNFLTYFTAPLLIVQDFPRDRLVQSRPEIHSTANMNQQGRP